MLTIDHELGDGGVAPSADIVPPPPAEQLALIDLNLDLEIDQSYFLVSDRWWSSFKQHCRSTDQPSPGPIDNSNLLDSPSSSSLRPYLVENLHYVLVSKPQWDLLVSWYGALQPGISRRVIEVGRNKTKMVEVYLLKFEVEFTNDKGYQKTFSVEMSKAATVADLKKAACTHFNVTDDESSRLRKSFGGIHETPEPSDQLESAFDTIVSEKITLEVKQDGGWPSEAPESSSPSYSFSSSSSSSYSPSTVTSSYPYSSRYSSSDTSDRYSSGYSSSLTSSSYSDRYSNFYDYSSPSPPIAKGATGLSNLGNTCFMNSGIQCLSNTPPLVQFFLTGQYLDDLNQDNPLGMGGKIAEEFGSLVKEIWSGRHSSVAPRDLKSTIGRFAPQFSGYAQHDSQELLAFLLDGLHEDLNRIKKKPFVEIKDAAGRSDEIAAEEAWEGHLKRNHSIISDLFHGQFKSRVTCPSCPKISVTFDPLMYLSLPLPSVDSRAIVVTFLPKDTSKRPLKIKALVPKRGSVTILKDKVAEILDLPKTHLLMAEVYDHRFHTFYLGQSLRDIREEDEVYAYETSAPVRNPSDMSVDEEEVFNLRVTLQVRSSVDHSSSYYRSQLTKNKGVPFILSIKREPTYHELYVAIKEQLSRFALRPLDEVEKQLQRNGASHEQELSERDGTPESIPMQTEETEAEAEAEAMLDSFNDKMEETDSQEIAPKAKQRKKEPTYLFKIQKAPSYYGSEDIEDKENPLRLRNNSNLVVMFEKEVYEELFSDEHFEKSEDHPSISEKPADEPELSVDSCLRLFLKEERLGEDNAWYCPDCKEHRQAFKKFDLWKLPEILIIHLKRFSYNTYSRDKIDSVVNFPLTGLDLSSYILGPQAIPPVYDLFAVSNHFGGLGGGHYTAYAKNHEDGAWYNFDDSSVRKITPESIQTSAAYVLFYRRRAPSDSDASN